MYAKVVAAHAAEQAGRIGWIDAVCSLAKEARRRFARALALQQRSVLRSFFRVFFCLIPPPSLWSSFLAPPPRGGSERA